YSGYVMSDWGATHSTVRAALAGLDQESGWIFDREPYFGAPLRQAVRAGRVPVPRLDDMARRILCAMFDAGVVNPPAGDVASPIDFAADTRIAEADEAQGIVLLKNESPGAIHDARTRGARGSGGEAQEGPSSAGAILPLARTTKRLLIVGGHADRGVISGGGSSTVFPVGGNAVPGLGPTGFPGPIVYLPSAPLAAIMGQSPLTAIRYVS